MWALGCEDSWVLKNWCFWTVVLEKTLESPLDSKETQPVHPKGDQSWIFIRRTEAEAPILWPPDAKSRQGHWKRPWCWERLKAGGEGEIGWDGWNTSPTQRAWVWANSERNFLLIIPWLVKSAPRPEKCYSSRSKIPCCHSACYAVSLCLVIWIPYCGPPSHSWLTLPPHKYAAHIV